MRGDLKEYVSIEETMRRGLESMDRNVIMHQLERTVKLRQAGHISDSLLDRIGSGVQVWG